MFRSHAAFARVLGLSVSAIGLAAGLQTPSLAQEAASQVEDIIVTARRTEERLQDAPVAVTALSGEQLESRGITAVAELQQSAPNLNVTQGIAGGSSSNAAIFIRGIGQRDFVPTVDPGVGVYRDGVYLGRSVGANLDFADIQRVEVLRGPQGTLYGKNTIGGTVNVITRRPSDDPSLEVRARVGERNRFDFDLVANGPLGDGLAGKLAVAARTADGFMHRVTDGRDLSDENRFMARGELLFSPSDDLDVLFAVDATIQEQESRAGNILFVDQTNPNTGNTTIIGAWNAQVAPGLGLQPLTTATANYGDPYTIGGTSASYDDGHSYGVALTVDRRFSFGQLRSITAWREMKSEFSAPIQPIFANLNDFEQSQLSQELQLSGSSFSDKLDWIVGAYYFNEDAHVLSGARLWTGYTIAIPSAAACRAGTGVVCQDFNNDNDLTTSGQSYSAYGQGTLSLTDRLRVTGGLRYTYEKKDFSVVATQLQLNRVAVSGTAEDSWDDVSPMVSADFKLTDDAMVYGRVARGFKSGGFNGRPNNTNAVQPVNPETVLSYELGAKTEWFDRRLRLNLAAFLNQYDDYQEIVSVTDPTFGLLTLVENIAELETKGFELEVTARPTSQLTLTAALGYTDAEYVDVGTTTSFGVEDIPVQVPEWTGAVGVDYVQPLANGGEITWRADWSYNSGYENYINNVKAGSSDTTHRDGLETEAFQIVNARIGWTPSAESRWEAALYARNLFDESYIVSAGYNSGSGNATSVPNAPREVGLQIIYRR